MSRFSDDPEQVRWVEKRDFIVGSRGSKLALIQTGMVIQRLRERYPAINFTVKEIKTTGDRDSRTSLVLIGGQGIFVKELEEALLANEIDMAVHSLKDVPSAISADLRLAAVGLRQEVRDAFISRTGSPLSRLPSGAIVGTGSPRRMAQLRAIRPDLKTASLRGNMDTRLNKLYAGQFDGVLASAAALVRMGWEDRITEYLATEQFLPMVGQGAVVVETRAADRETNDLVSVINDETTSQAVSAERSFLRTLGGGCRAPIAALATIEDGVLRLQGMVASVDGTGMVKAEEMGLPSEAERMGELLAIKLLAMGAQRFIGEGTDGRS